MDDQLATHGLVRLSGETTGRLLADPARAAQDAARDRELSPAEMTAHVFNELQGTWSGHRGFNLIALPSPGSKPTDLGDFVLGLQSYSEILELRDPGAPARNRGGDVDQFVAALEYRQRVTDATSDVLLHAETGMFLNLSTIVKNGTTDREPVPELNIARSGTIPHGDSIMLLGGPPVRTDGPPSIPEASALPTNVSPKAPATYNDPYLQAAEGPVVADPNLLLRQTLEQQAEAGIEVLNTTTFTLDSEHGGINNIPFIDERANTVRMTATFWLEKIRSAETGQEVDQLQYSQVIDLDFHQNSPDPATGLIRWPHVTVNTLLKQ